jgi:hypothetical protein
VKYPGENPLNNECTLKKIKDRNVKQGGKGEHENRG